MPRYPHPTLLTIRSKPHPKGPTCLLLLCLRSRPRPPLPIYPCNSHPLPQIHIHILPHIQSPHPRPHLTDWCRRPNNHLWCSPPRQIRTLARRSTIIYHILILILHCHREPCREPIRRGVAVTVDRWGRLICLIRIRLDRAMVGIYRWAQKRQLKRITVVM